MQKKTVLAALVLALALAGLQGCGDDSTESTTTTPTTTAGGTTTTTARATTTTTAGGTTTTTAAGTTTTTSSVTTTTLAGPSVPVAVAGANTTPDDASVANKTYTIAAGTYTYNISGFGPGDVLAFPAGNTATINNTNFTDGTINVLWASSGQTVTIHLTGIPAATDGTVFGYNSFKTAFGSSSLSP